MAVIMNLRTGISVFSLMMLGACAGVAKTPAVTPLISQGTLGQLAPRDLKSGDCGLFVWSAEATRRLILFSQNSTGLAAWHDGSQEHVLTLKTRAGDKTLLQYPEQELVTQTGKLISLSLRKAQAIESGMRYKAGVLSYTDSEGWRAVVPVVGLASCAPRSQAGL
jgi:hypothetical protein